LGSPRANFASITVRVVVFETLKANRRKTAQVVIFKDAKKIFDVRVDNFVRNCPNFAGNNGDCNARISERYRTEDKSPFLFKGLQFRSQ
jgi:hypothetical protein